MSNGIQRRGFLAAMGAGAVAPLVGSLASPAAAGTRPPGPPGRGPWPGGTIPGVDDLAARGWEDIAGERVGVITNPTGILRDLRHEVDVMAASDAVDLRAVFGPEHGFRGTAQAGDAEDTYVDERTGITVYDAYGATADTFAELYERADVETVVFDIQDVGARFYTYVWTMYYAMVAAARTGRRFVVLDRPNPVGGVARGPMMTTEFTTFVGLKEIVQQHGMTVGELARFFDGEFLPADAGTRLDDLHVVPVRRWRSDVPFIGTGLPWVPPSPNMPTPDTALVYPGTCMFEGTLFSEGRGTTRPFEFIGAPGVDYRWAESLADDLPGLSARDAYFTPVFSKQAGEVCGGLQLHVDNPAGVDAVRAGVAMLVEAHRIYPEFEWRYDAWDTARPYWIDKLSGSRRLRTMVDAGASVDDIVGSWEQELAEFDDRRQQYLVYRGADRA